MSGRSSEPRRGATVVEALVSLLLTFLIVELVWGLAAAARRAVVRLMEAEEALVTERVGWHVLQAEVRGGVPGRDWEVLDGTVLPVRAFRGVAEPCAEVSSSGAVVRYRGIRLPEPDKDSVLVLTGGGAWRAVRLASREAGGEACGAYEGGRVERWTWEPPVEGPLLLRLYERGSYHLEDGAVRYRIGRGGRQPLTPEALAPDGSGFSRGPGGAPTVRFRVRVGEEGVREWTRALPDGDAGTPRR